MDLIFKLFSGMVWVLSQIAGWTFVQAIAILFAYGEPLVLLGTSLLPAAFVVYCLYRHRSPQRFAALFGTMLYSVPFCVLWSKMSTRYHALPVSEAGALLRDDLHSLSEATGLSYQATTLLLFIVVFLFALILNLFLLYVVRACFINLPRRSRRKRTKRRSR